MILCTTRTCLEKEHQKSILVSNTHSLSAFLPPIIVQISGACDFMSKLQISIENLSKKHKRKRNNNLMRRKT